MPIEGRRHQPFEKLRNDGGKPGQGNDRKKVSELKLPAMEKETFLL